ncbi:RuvB-like protein 2 [Nematocida sp. AWRm80]|nr:RuvB-like protein 2 [Nematocida sp. AWRm80]
MTRRGTAISNIQRIGAHTHIKGLGLDKNMNEIEEGVVGKLPQRRALRILLKSTGTNKGRLVLLAGPSGSGKSALLTGMTKELEKEGIPYKYLVASEIYSSTHSKIEILTQAIRQTIGLRIKEKCKILQGEVTEISIDRETSTNGRIVMKTTDVDCVFSLGEKIIQELYNERVEVGDIIRVNKTIGTIKKLGRSANKHKETEALGAPGVYLPCPDGELVKVEEETHTVTFHEIDVLNTKSQGYHSLLNTATEIPTEVRDTVDAKMCEWIEEGRGTLATGVLFIDESHLLDIECYSFLNTIAELKISPIIIFSTSKESGCIRGTDQIEQYCVPKDFFSRVLLIRTHPATAEENQKILQIRAVEENARIQEDGLQELFSLAQTTSLRYAFNILSAADALANRLNRPAQKEDIQRVSSLFISETIANN